MPRDMTPHHGKQQRPTAYHSLFLDKLAKTYLPPIAQLVKNAPAMQETRVRSLGREDPLEKGTATHSSIPALRIPMDKGAWRATVPGVTDSG